MRDGLAERLASPGYTPRVRELPAVLALLAHEEPDRVRQAERALLSAGAPALELALAAHAAATRPLRGRITALVGRLATAQGVEGPATRFLLGCLADPDPETRRRAISGLGRRGDPRFEEALLEVWDAATLPEDRRALARALGNVGGASSVRRLEQRTPGDPELERLCEEATLKVMRRQLRGASSLIDPSASSEGLRVLLHVRAGFEELLLDELGSGESARTVGPGRVQVEPRGPLEDLFRARTFLHLGFPLPPELVEGDGTEAVVRALTSDAAHRIFTTFTRGPVRYRLEWADAGRRRAATFDVAARVLAARPGLHNDGTKAIWEAVVTERGARIFVELWPVGLADPRFTYRLRALPASSHPTVAAALARVAGARADDVVWDPFVGSGTELVERARLGPYASLHGTDASEDALAAARVNLAAAGIQGVVLLKGDARREPPPEGLSLVLTNPPFGHRVLPGQSVSPLLEAVLSRVVAALRPGGRVAWISPAGDTTHELARRHGLTTKLRRPVDMGGLPGELQLFVAETRKVAPPEETRSRRRRRR